MAKEVSKSQFKPRALELFREVQQTGEELVITERGKPVLRLVPFVRDLEDVLRSLRGTVVQYDEPTEPVGLELWEGLR